MEEASAAAVIRWQSHGAADSAQVIAGTPAAARAYDSASVTCHCQAEISAANNSVPLFATAGFLFTLAAPTGSVGFQARPFQGSVDVLGELVASGAVRPWAEVVKC